MKITSEEQQEVIEIIQNYRKLHDNIAEIEVSMKDLDNMMKELRSKKDVIIDGIKDNRKREGVVIESMISKYGKGRLNLDEMNWLPNETNSETVKTEDNGTTN